MVKVRIEGETAESAALVGAIVTKALRDAGVKVTRWNDVGRNEVRTCIKDARDNEAQVAVMEMR